MDIIMQTTIKEIERKFLVNPIYWQEYLNNITEEFNDVFICRHYLPVEYKDGIASVERLSYEKNKNNKQYFHFIKSNAINNLRNRQEIITPLTKEKYFELLDTKFKNSKSIEKTRYILPIKEVGISDFVFDEIQVSIIQCSDLYVFEIEFENEEYANKFDPTKYPFLGLEVTDDIKYTNAYLAI